MNRKFIYSVLFILMLLGASFVKDTSAAAFTTGNIVVCRVTSGAALNAAATATFVDEYTPAGALVQSIALPTADAGAQQTLTNSGSGTTDCAITRSSDGRFLLITGYDAAVGTAAVAGTSTATILRVIGRIDAGGTVDTSTTTTSFSGGSIRSASSDNGTNLWSVGSNTGVVYTTFGGTGAGTIVSATNTNFRVTKVIGGNLFVSAAAGTRGIGQVGTGLPTTTGNTTTYIPGLSTTAGNNNGFLFADLDAGVAGNDTLYIADDQTSAGATGGGVKKYSLVGGTWTYNGTFPAAAAPVAVPATAFYGLTGSVAGTTVTLYATRTSGATSATSQLVSFVDATGYNVAPVAVPTFLASPTGGTNSVFRGAAFAPTTPTAAAVNVGGRITESNGRGIARVVVTLTDSQGSIRSTYTNQFGFYTFADVAAGDTYIFSATHRRYRFAEPTQVRFIGEDAANINFVSSSSEGLMNLAR